MGPKTYLCEFVELLNVSAAVVLSRGELRREKSVDEGRLAQSGLACKLRRISTANMIHVA
jgi:hypothetical protein